ncbi:MAG: zinc ribbon domain-containing protein [Actinomycetia bacterium]|nr:zinc ribbon domain-containing protein [Actinomycetes bacterium]
MPIYEFVCMTCESHFEELIRNGGDEPPCPDCASTNTRRLLSVFATSASSGEPSFGAQPRMPSGGGGCCGGGCGCG